MCCTRKKVALWCVGVIMVLLIGYGVVCLSDYGCHKDKLWLHRCNSLEKLAEKRADYPNVEVDVVFRPENSVYDVTHDEDVSYGLSLSEYFAELGRTQGRMWIDFKNLDAGNCERALTVMDSLTRRYGIDRRRLIIENNNGDAVEAFTRAGYYTSLYSLPAMKGELSDEQIASELERMRGAVDRGQVCAVSFPACWYSTVKEGLGRDVDLLTWDFLTTQAKFLLTPWMRGMLNDPSVKVILLKSRGHEVPGPER